MDYKTLSNKIFEKGKSKINEMEVFIEKNKEFELEVFQGEVDKYSISESGGLSLRGLSNGKMGYSYTEKIDESSIDMLVDEAYENGKHIDSLDKEIISSGSDKYKTIQKHSELLKNISTQDKIDFLKLLEKEVLGLDERVDSVQVVSYKEVEQERYIMNTKGVDLWDKFTGAMSYISVIVKDGDEVKTGMSYRVFNDFSKIDYKEMAKEAVEEGISMLGATTIKSSSYPVIIKNHVFASILSAFISVLSADNVQKGFSLLKDKIDTKIASEILNIVDDPFLENGFASKSFDDEGTATEVIKIVDNGVLKTYFHNIKTAEKDNVESTGHGSRSSYKGSLAISPSNLYVEKGNNSFQELIESINKGLLIIDVAGLHSGLNPISGDFSLSASGYTIENGNIDKPVDLITIAGNFYELLKDIEGIGDDLRFSFPGKSYVGSPSVKIKSLAVAGE